MTDPLKLAEEIDRWAGLRQTGDLTTMQMRPETWRLLAAALRLAECAAYSCPGTTLDSAIRAYLKAKGDE